MKPLNNILSALKKSGFSDKCINENKSSCKEGGKTFRIESEDPSEQFAYINIDMGGHCQATSPIPTGRRCDAVFARHKSSAFYFIEIHSSTKDSEKTKVLEKLENTVKFFRKQLDGWPEKEKTFLFHLFSGTTPRSLRTSNQNKKKKRKAEESTDGYYKNLGRLTEKRLQKPKGGTNATYIHRVPNKLEE